MATWKTEGFFLRLEALGAAFGRACGDPAPHVGKLLEMSSPKGRLSLRRLCLLACLVALAEIAERGDEVLREHAADIVARAAILLTDPSRIHFAKNAFRLLGRLGETAHAKTLQDVIDNESLPQNICAAAFEALQLINTRKERAASINISTAACIMQRGKRFRSV